MMLTRTALCLIAISFALPVVAQEPESTAADRLSALRKRFPAADANNDGVLTQSEAQAYREKLRPETQVRSKPQRNVKPTAADVPYGDHVRNRLDFYRPQQIKDTARPLPVFVYFHGGGFVAGDKAGFDAAPYLDRGYAVVSCNYRFVDGSTTLCPAPLLDAARAIQFLKHKSKEWNLDPDRIAVSGSSAGAVISLWIAYHDDLADLHSSDPIARESTRVRCVVPINGPTNLDPRWITPNMGGPKQIHGSFPKMFGATVAASDTAEVRERIIESSPIEHASKDDPPTLLIYTGKNEGIPLPESASTGVLIHHARFGQALSERLDQLGVEYKFLPGTDPRKDSNQVILDWLDAHMDVAKP